MNLPTKLILVTLAALGLCLSPITGTSVADLQAPTPTLAGHNIEPFELKAIKAESVDAPIEHAPLRNQTQSLQATGLTLKKGFNQAHIRLKNVSGKNIIGYMICVFETSSESSACQGGGFGPVLKPGEENTIFFPNFPFRVFRSEPGGLIEFPTDKQELVIRTAVFEDGSFEGDAKAAAGIMREQAEWKTNRGK